MDVILATVANGRQAIVDINREAGRNELINPSIYYLIQANRGFAKLAAVGSMVLRQYS